VRPTASPRVLVTRSEPGASETGRRLADLCYAPIVEPVFAVEAISAELPPFDALAFTSANGVRAFARLNIRRDAPVFCVGDRTAEEARQAGFSRVQSADGDVAALAALIEARLPPGGRILHTGNEESRGDLAGTLSARGRPAAFVPTFRAMALLRPGPALAAHLEGRIAFETILVHSARAAAILADFASRARNPAPLDVAAISPAAVSPLVHLARRIETAIQPNEAALLNSLGLLCDLG
jgi:uroporphyrinogen-III synthase